MLDRQVKEGRNLNGSSKKKAILEPQIHPESGTRNSQRRIQAFKLQQSKPVRSEAAQERQVSNATPLPTISEDVTPSSSAFYNLIRSPARLHDLKPLPKVFR